MCLEQDADTMDGKIMPQQLSPNSFSEAFASVPTEPTEPSPWRHNTQLFGLGVLFYLISVCVVSTRYGWAPRLPNTNVAREGCRMQAAGLLKASSHMSEADRVSPQKSTPADKKPFL